MPFQVASAAAAAGRKVLVIGLEGEADERLKAFRFETIKWGQFGRTEELMSAHGAREVVLIGSVSRRPDFRSIGLDLGTLRLLPRILKSIVGGDDHVLGNLITYLEERGFRVVGAHEIAPELVAEAGQLAGPRAEPGDARRRADRDDGGPGDRRTRHRAGRRLRSTGWCWRWRRPKAPTPCSNGSEHLHAIGRVKWSGRAGVLAKCSKPQQDLRVDMPTIGPRTVAAVVAAGLAGIAIEAGRVMIAERAETLKAAEDSGTFILAAADGDVRPAS